MQIALLAYDSLPLASQRRLDDILRAHPRFREDILAQLPSEMRAPEQQARWLFALASTWPDMARGQAQYDHRTWHYVNLRLELRGERLVSCQEARRLFEQAERQRRSDRRRAAPQAGRPALTAALPTSNDSEPDSILGALQWAHRTWLDSAQAPDQRALALSWLLHLVADAHQPLHGVALFTDSRFRSGDRGGNDILLRDAGLPSDRDSLHRVWDGLLGDEMAPAAVEPRVRSLRNAEHLQAEAGRASQELSPDRWIDESCSVARSIVYAPDLLRAVRRFERAAGASASDKVPVTLSPAYLEAAASAARRRAAQAGARLRALLASGLSSRASSVQGPLPASP